MRGLLIFFQTINSCGMKSFSTPSKRSLNEYLIVKHKRSSSVLNVGINASFFREFERKLNLSDGNVVKAGKFITACVYVKKS